MNNSKDYQSCTCAFCFNELHETEKYESLIGVYGDMLNKLLIQLVSTFCPFYFIIHKFKFFVFKCLNLFKTERDF